MRLEPVETGAKPEKKRLVVLEMERPVAGDAAKATAPSTTNASRARPVRPPDEWTGGPGTDLRVRTATIDATHRIPLQGWK